MSVMLVFFESETGMKSENAYSNKGKYFLRSLFSVLTMKTQTAKGAQKREEKRSEMKSGLFIGSYQVVVVGGAPRQTPDLRS